ncbi:MAG TPA: hypothetical protein VFO10_12925 [Oligoflexus sp.]|uniref:hypothetical protein n=1 Tax=Oligoflexus sp. TaxID=1971216 RepID=UPI002D8034FA|nr:hypothetical protein [Oligoflexus sp.]HET9238155.1 hypothetical protein [Oligoflexus sp.]
MQRPWVVATLFCLNAAAAGASPANLLPVAQKLPITPDNFCLGAQNVLKTAKQVLTDELAVLCTGNTATTLFKNLIAAPYAGTGTPALTQVFAPRADNNARTSEIMVAFAMRIPKTAVNTLLVEEKHAIVPYDSEAQPPPLGNQLANMKMSFQFMEPPKNEGDADTTFALQQTVDTRSVAVNFKDVSNHELRQYILHPDNFDFFMAGRTLVAPTEQFKKSVVVRGFMTDPADATKTLVVTVAHFLMNSRDQHEQLVLAFSNFLTTDVSKLYQEQIKP